MPEDFSGVIDFVESTVEDFTAELVRVAKRLDREIQLLASQFDVRGGSFATNEENLGRLVDLRQQIDQALVEAGYPDAVANYMDRAPELRDRVLNAWNNIVPGAAFRTVDVQALDEIIGSNLDAFANVAEQGTDIIRRNLVQAVTSGRDYRDFANELRDFLRGQGDLRDKAGAGMFRHANTLAQTAMDELGRTMDKQLGENAGVKRFQYVGGVISTTRPFCRGLNGQILTRSEIDELDNGQTGTGSVFIAGGGWNCRHRWLPIVD
jgi:hypothetical protein